VHVATVEKYDDDDGEADVLDEGFLSWEGGNGEVEDYDHNPKIEDIMGDYFDDPNKAQTHAGALLIISAPPLSFDE
jgi:hypothetical protein